MLITACVCSILYHILECTHTDTLFTRFILIVSLLSLNLNKMSNIMWTSTAFNDTFWRELRFWCHNPAEFCTACKKWKFWYRPFLLFGSRNERKTWPLRFLFYVVTQRYYSIAWHWLIHTRNHSFIHSSIHSFVHSVLRQVRSVFQSEFSSRCDLVLPLSVSGILLFL